MSLTPLNVLRDHQSRYVQLFAISQLKINVQRFLKPVQVDNVDPIASLLSTTVDGLSALSFIVDFFVMMDTKETNRIQFTSIPASDARLVFSLAKLVRSLEILAPMISDLQRSYEDGIRQAAVDQPGNLIAWREAVHPLLQYQIGFSGILRTLQMVQRGEAITPQALYQTALDLHASSLQLTRVRDRLDTHLVSELERCDTEKKLPRKFALGGAVVGSVTGYSLYMGFLASNPVGWGLLVALCGLGTLSACCGGNQWMRISDKKKTIRKVQRDLKDLANVFNEVRNDIIATICSTVLGIELNCLSDDEKKKILQGFAIDVNALQHQVYSNSLLGSGVDKVLRYYEDLTSDVDELVRVYNLEVDVAEVP